MPRLVIRSKDRFEPDGIIEVVVWELEVPLAPCQHHFKYRLYCGSAGVCLVRYDNERGKGDHVHYGEFQQAYAFSTLERLLQDFQQDISRVRK